MKSVSVIAGAFILLAGGTALAQDEAIVEHRDRGIGLELFGEVGLGWTEEDDDGTNVSVVSPRFAALYWFEGVPLGLAAEWGFVRASSSGPVLDDSYTYSGNPYVSGHFNLEALIGMVDLGVGVATPVRSAPDDPDDPNSAIAATATEAALAIRGWEDFWLWLPDRLSLVVPARLALDLPLVAAAVDGAFAMMFGTADNQDNEVGVQLGIEAALNLGPVDLGVRGQRVWFPGESGDNSQYSFGPYARANFGVVFAQGRMVWNVDSPAGTSFVDDGAYWGLHFGGGVNL